MEPITVILMGSGFIWIILNLVLGIVEISTVGTIRPPKKQSFNSMLFNTRQYQTVFVPAIGTLLTGLLVSLAASFFYDGLFEDTNSLKALVGLVLFFVSAIVLTVLLWPILKNEGEPAELARDPFAIRAAAAAFTESPRHGGIEPELLIKRLDEWEACISARSLNLSVNGASAKLLARLTRAAQERTFLRASIESLRVYLLALVEYPFRFMWPLVGLLLLVGGTIGYSVGPGELPFSTSWRPWLAVALFSLVGAVPTLFYCITRGNRARLWHRINLNALHDARTAIAAAAKVKKCTDAEDARKQQMLIDAGQFLQRFRAGGSKDERTILRIGRLRISKE